MMRSEKKPRFLAALRSTGPLRKQLVKEGELHQRILSLALKQAYGRSGINNREEVCALRKNDPKFSAEYETIIAEIKAELSLLFPLKEQWRLASARYRAREQEEAAPAPPPRLDASGLEIEARKNAQVAHRVRLIEIAGGFFDMDARRAFQTEALALVKQYAWDPAKLTAELDELTDDFMPAFDDVAAAPEPKPIRSVHPYVQFYRDVKLTRASREAPARTPSPVHRRRVMPRFDFY